jgi:flagellar protein FlaJ
MDIRSIHLKALNWIKKHDYRELRKDLKSARICISHNIYVLKSIMYALSLAAMFLLLTILIPLFSDSIQLFNIDLPYFEYYSLLTPLIGYTVYKIALYYPRYVSSIRRIKIDLILPHAAAFCFGMSKGGASIYEIFKELAKNGHVYGEVSKEALFIVRDVELLGYDVCAAIKNVAKTTSSERFREFLENLLPMIESGDVEHYFSVKMDQYFEHAKRTQSMFLKTLEMVGEVYVVAFVAVPIFLLITFVTIGIMEMPYASYVFQALFFGIPIGSVAMILFLESISPKEDLGVKYVQRVILRRFISVEEGEGCEEKIKEYRAKKKRIRFLNYIKNFSFIYKPLYALCLGLLLAPFPFLLLEESLNKQLLIAVIFALIPLSFAYELKTRKLEKIDRIVPDFLRRLAEINEVGLTLRDAIRMLLKSDLGLLSKEIRRMWLDMEWGSEMKEALVRLENRIGTPSMRRAITLLTKTSEMTDNVRDVLLIAAADAENTISLRKDRFNVTFIYIATIYISFGVFLYVCYSLSTQFMTSLAKLSPVVNISELNSIMFATCGLLGFFSGLIAGQMGEGRLLFGLKHTIILLLLTYLVFTILMGY